MRSQDSNSDVTSSDAAASSKNTSSNPIEYSEQERVELLRRLDSIKDHLLRGGNKPKETEQNQPFLRPIHLHAPNHPYYHQQDPYRRPSPVPNTYGHYPNHMTPPYVDPPHSYYPGTPNRFSDMMPPYSPSFPSSMSSPGGYARWPSNLDSEMGGCGAFARGYVKKAVSNSEARRCHPLAGGAPFIACGGCFELLYLPKKKLLAQERLHTLQCGACSQVITFKIVDKKLVFTSGNEGMTEPVSLEVEDISIRNIVVVEDEEEHVQELKNQGATTKSIRSESQHSDEEERLSVSSEQQHKEVKPAASESASLLELFEYSNVNRAALAYGMEELGDHKKEVFMKQDSVKPESVATETEVSYNGYSNTEISEESRCSNGGEDKNRTRNRNEDQGKSLEVWVNGHLIPEDLVSSAEKLAGPIQGGKYWYDYRAGFWGVMGKPCLGVIPPFIEEFSHPMPARCAAGNTEVYVNGRELHKRDLELLVGRGLPRDKNRSYILDISGRVLDGDSGEQLKSLGKLAPTIEKTKHGFGMRVPRSLAS